MSEPVATEIVAGVPPAAAAGQSVAEPPGVAGVPPPPRPPSVGATCLVVAGRAVRTFLRSPQQVVTATVYSALFLLMFRYLLGGFVGAGRVGALRSGEISYVDFFVPGYVVGGALFSGTGAAAGVARDVEQGFADRLRSLPVSRVALLAGRSLAETAILTWGMVVAIAVGFLVGFRLHCGLGPALGALGLSVVCGFAFTWLFISVGLLAGSPQAAAQGTSMLVFPAMAVSSALVPVETLPGWLHPIADHQPVTVMTNAVRSLTLGGPDAAGLGGSAASWVALSLAWCAGLLAVFAPLAALRYRRS